MSRLLGFYWSGVDDTADRVLQILTNPARSPEHRIVSAILHLKNLKGTF